MLRPRDRIEDSSPESESLEPQQLPGVLVSWVHMEISQNLGAPFGGPHDKEYSLSGLYWVPPNLGNDHVGI